jgi:hypothetical protein
LAICSLASIRDPVHHLDRARDHAGLHDLRHRLARRVRGVEERHERLDRLGRGHHAQPHLGGDPERALRADERAEQVVARGIELRTAQRDQLAVGQDDLQPAHVVRREPVLEAVRAAGVLGHVAADGAHDLRAGIGRVEEVGRHRGRDRRVRHAGLDAYALVGEVDLEHALQAGRDDQDAVGDRQRAAGQPGARAPRHPGGTGLRAGAHARLDLSGAPREHDGSRRRRVLQQPVGLVGAQLVLGRVAPLVPHDLAQPPDQLLHWSNHTR